MDLWINSIGYNKEPLSLTYKKYTCTAWPKARKLTVFGVKVLDHVSAEFFLKKEMMQLWAEHTTYVYRKLENVPTTGLIPYLFHYLKRQSDAM